MNEYTRMKMYFVLHNKRATILVDYDYFTMKHLLTKQVLFFCTIFKFKERLALKMLILLIAITLLPILHFSLWMNFYDRNIDNLTLTIVPNCRHFNTSVLIPIYM